MSNNTASRSAGLSNVLGLVKKYSFVLVFLAIFVVYAIANGGLTLNATMNVLRHSAVIGTIAIGMGIVCASRARSIFPWDRCSRSWRASRSWCST